MKTIILGGGALGSIIGAHLHRAGRDVVIVAREPRAGLLAREGVRITGIADFVAKVPIVREVAEAADGDLYINALKTFQSPAVIGALRPRPGAWAFSVQNGVYKNAELAAVFGEEGVLGASAMISGEVLPDGAVRFTVNDSLLIGEPAGGRSERCGAIATMLDEAGVRTAVSPAIRSVEWAKYAIFVPSFCLATITRKETHRFLQHPGTAAVMAALAREMAAIAAAEGVTLPASGVFSAAGLAAVDMQEAVRLTRAFGDHMAANAPRHKVSALQDLERGRQTEVEEIVGHACLLAQRHGLDLPVLRTCHGLSQAAT
ncbi:MAG: 2-dehydropantoate 2-reductase [Rubrivivax sp.]